MSEATKAKLSAAGKRRWRNMSASAKASVTRRLKGGGSAPRKARKAAKKAARASRRASRPARTSRRSPRGMFNKLSNMSVGQVADLIPAARGLATGVSRALAYRAQYPDEPGAAIGIGTRNGLRVNTEIVKQVFGPVIGGAATSGGVRAYRGMAPSLGKKAMAIRPLKFKMPKFSLGEVVDALPWFAGTGAAIVAHEANRNFYQNADSPELAAVGIVSARGSDLSLSIDRHAAAIVLAPAAVATVSPKLIHGVRTSGLIAGPVKRLFSLHT